MLITLHYIILLYITLYQGILLYYIIFQPYVASYDTIPDKEYQIPTWISETIDTRNYVHISAMAESQLDSLLPNLELFRNDVLIQLKKRMKKKPGMDPGPARWITDPKVEFLAGSISFSSPFLVLLLYYNII